MKSIKLFILFFSTAFLLMNAIQAPPLKTSLIIPCYYKHAKYLYSLLKLYEFQTVPPDEVVISISEFKKIDPMILDALNNEQWSFSVKIIVSEKEQFAGENRNIACQKSTGDLLILQDADDIPHPQRIQIIKYFFEHYKVDHLMHEYAMSYTKQKRMLFEVFSNLNNIDIEWPQCFEDAIKNGVTNGNIAISREVFNKIQWTAKPIGQDVSFNSKVYSEFKNALIIKIPLITYHRFLSSHVEQEPNF